jgi:hypothetical protein
VRYVQSTILQSKTTIITNPLAGPTAQSLNELVLRINSEEEVMAEGPVKFNAFICGLLKYV